MEDVVFKIEVFGFNADGEQIYEEVIEEIDPDEAYQALQTVTAMSKNIDNVRNAVCEIPDDVKTLSLELNQYDDDECVDEVFQKEFSL